MLALISLSVSGDVKGRQKKLGWGLLAAKLGRLSAKGGSRAGWSAGTVGRLGVLVRFKFDYFGGVVRAGSTLSGHGSWIGRSPARWLLLLL